MRILILLTQDIESPSGLGRYYPLARAFAEQGHAVTIAALHPRFESLPQGTVHSGGVTVQYVAPMHVRKHGSAKEYYSPFKLAVVLLRAAFQLTRAALRTPADIIVVGKPHPMNGIAGLIGRAFRRGRLVVDCDDFEAGSGHFKNALQRRVVALFERYLPRLADAVTTNTLFMRENLIRWGVAAGKIFYLPNGYDEQRFKEPDPNMVEKLAAGLDLRGHKVIAFIGSLSLVNHPVDLLVEAFARVRAAVPAAVLLIVGGGEDLETLRNMAAEIGVADAVRFCGRVPPDAVPLYYRLADVTVDPVYDDDAARGRCPLKLFEGWASGVPVVTSDVGDRKMLAGDPPSAKFAGAGDSASLANAIIAVLNDPVQSETLAARGAEIVQDYGWQTLAQQWLDQFGEARSPQP